MGFLCRRPARPDGSPGHRQVRGDGFLHRGTVHLESFEARAQSDRRGCAGAARGMASGDARPQVSRRILETWGPALIAQRPEITMATIDKFVTNMFETNADFVFTVTRDFVRNCQNPILILPDDVRLTLTPLLWNPRCSRRRPK